MPELPEVEILVNQLAPRLRRATITGFEARDRRLQMPRKLLGRKILSIRRRAKFIIFQLTGGNHLLIHLRMTGWFEFAKPAKYRLAIQTNRGTIYFDDPRCMGVVRVVSSEELQQLLGKLGPEPLEPGFSLQRLHAKARPVKVALLDQQLVAGIGNIWASESLWRARIDPRRHADRLRPDQLHRLRRAIVTTLRQAISLGDTIFEHDDRWAVYGREGERCRRCGTVIRRIVQAQRSTFFCGKCQR